LYNNATSPPPGGSYEMLCWDSGSTGQIINCGLYKANAAGYLHSNYSNFTKTNVRYDYYSNVSGRQTSWDWNTPGDYQGWHTFSNHWSNPSVSSGKLWGSSTGGDPYAHSGNTWINTHQYPFVEVNMKQTQGNTATIFFVTETDGTWGSRNVNFDIIPDDQYHTYTVDMRENPDWKGVVTEYRLDPTTSSGSDMAVDSFTPLTE